MGFKLLISLRLIFFLLVVQGYAHQATSNIRLGFSLTPVKNPAWHSPSGLFAFGFYPQDDRFAVGIWLTSTPEITVVWTANRDDLPVSSNSTIELTREGWLLLHTTHGEDKNITQQFFPATSASMLDSGNFLLYNHSDVIWESFDYPCDTILVGQQLTAGDQLVSSLSPSQHMSGNFILNLQHDGNLVAYPLTSSWESDDAYWSTGLFDYFYERVSLNLAHNGSLYLEEDGVTLRAINPPLSLSPRSSKNETVIFRAALNSDGNFVLYSHRVSSKLTGKIEWAALKDPCEAKGICGPNSYCSSTSGNFDCNCFPGFLFFNNTRNGKLRGCYRNFTDQEACSGKELNLSYHITPLENIKLRHYSYSLMNLTKEACCESCLDDCSCWASMYANGSCKKLTVPIIYAALNKSILATVFIKTSVPKDTVEEPLTKVDAVTEKERVVYILAITLGCVGFMCTVMAFYAFVFYRVHAQRYHSISENIDLQVWRDQFSLRAFSFTELQKATDGFKEVIGRNTYGQVYKGFISEGKAVAVKRLERIYEGEGWFRAEITAIAQTHHRNLVALIGFCIHGATKLLVYEFMSNGSLEDRLFNAETPLVWAERVRVALEVARGILYLHEECDARIIHCNITPRNILFDESWTAKISDFGLSKLLRSNQSGTLLTGDRGTRGYLAPESHKNTLISTKVDIYSFGVLLLEILCCRNDREISVLSTWVSNCYVDKDWNRLIGDEEEEVDVQMLEKMVKLGLLCIQDDPDARPSIKNVILMLEGTADIPILPSPLPTPPSLL